jgi:hypothetical protein
MRLTLIRSLAVAAAASAGIAGCTSSPSAPTATGRTANAYIRPANFVQAVDNPWFPLRPGTVLRYRGVKDGKRTVNVVRVTRRTKSILGVRATVVADDLYDTRGRPVERTLDWYAQDRLGNVWYLGESTGEFDRGGRVTSRAGSWQAGVHGAQAGIVMPADPHVTTRFRQMEYLKGEAEDRFRTLDLAAQVRVPALSSKRALRTEERTALEPAVVDNKYYVRGIGTVAELAVKGPKEYNVLVSVRRGAEA